MDDYEGKEIENIVKVFRTTVRGVITIIRRVKDAGERTFCHSVT